MQVHEINVYKLLNTQLKLDLYSQERLISYRISLTSIQKGSTDAMNKILLLLQTKQQQSDPCRTVSISNSISASLRFIKGFRCLEAAAFFHTFISEHVHVYVLRIHMNVFIFIYVQTFEQLHISTYACIHTYKYEYKHRYKDKNKYKYKDT